MLLHPSPRRCGVPALAALLLALSASALCSVTVSPARVQGLRYSAADANQQATFTFNYAPPSGLGLTFIQWFLDGSGSEISQFHNSTTATVKAVGVGRHSLECRVYAYKQAGGYFNESVVTTFAAIGGPLSYDAFNAQDGVAVPKHDGNDVTKPFHLQYFDYTYGVSSKPTGAQQSQCGSAQPALTQLSSTTTYIWTITGPGQAFATGLNGPTVFVAANAKSGSGAIKARLAFHYDDGAGLVGDAQDDSEETPPPGQTAPNASYYSFTAHRPTRVEKVGSPVPLTHHVGGVYPSTDSWTYQDAFLHKLYDNNGDGQPGVWITERFPNAATAIAQWNAATGQSLSLSSAATTGLSFDSSSDGSLGNADQIGLQDIVANMGHPNPGTYPALILNQQYFAATHATTLGAWGILVQNWTNTCGTTSVSHEKS